MKTFKKSRKKSKKMFIFILRFMLLQIMMNCDQWCYQPCLHSSILYECPVMDIYDCISIRAETCSCNDNKYIDYDSSTSSPLFFLDWQRSCSFLEPSLKLRVQSPAWSKTLTIMANGETGDVNNVAIKSSLHSSVALWKDKMVTRWDVNCCHHSFVLIF